MLWPGGAQASREAGVRAEPWIQVRNGLGAWRLTHDEALCLREFAEQFPEVLIALFVSGTQHLPRGLGMGT